MCVKIIRGIMVEIASLTIFLWMLLVKVFNLDQANTSGIAVLTAKSWSVKIKWLFYNFM